jgi:hypothetical protein
MKINPEKVSGMESVVLNIIIMAVTLLVSRFTYVYIEDKFRRLVKKKVHEHSEKNAYGRLGRD